MYVFVQESNETISKFRMVMRVFHVFERLFAPLDSKANTAPIINVLCKAFYDSVYITPWLH